MTLTREDLDKLERIVKHQADLESLWLMNTTITEALLMAALRHLHAVIEGDDVSANRSKSIYWHAEDDL